MYSTTVYSYIPRQTVVLYSGTSARRYNIVYANTLKLNKGVTNKIQFQFLNQEQKPINITDLTVSFRLINYTGTEVYFRKALTPLLALKGLAQLEVSSDELAGVNPELCSYSLEVNEGELPVFVGANSEARGIIQVIDSVFPSYTPAIEISIPSHPTANATNIVTYNSSVVYGPELPYATMQVAMEDFTGNITVHGSTIPNSEWYDIQTETYANSSDTVGYFIEGYHPYIKVEFANSTGGNISTLLLR